MSLLLAVIVLVLLISFKQYSKNKQLKDECVCVVIADEKHFKEWSEPKLKKLNLPYIRSDPVYTKLTTYGSPGETGCVLAHKKVWKEASNRYIPTLVLEKDWTINPNISYTELRNQIIKATKSKKDMVRLGYCVYGNNMLCTHAYMISPKTAKKMNSILIGKALDYTFAKACNEKKISCEYYGRNLNTPKNLFGTGVILQDRENVEGMRDQTNKKTKLFY